MFDTNTWENMHAEHRDPFMQSAIDFLDQFRPNLWSDLGSISELSETDAKQILAFFIAKACVAQNMGHILIGRQAIHLMPQPWVRENLIACAEAELNLNDAWEFRRVLELCDTLDGGLLKHFVDMGMQSQNEEIREAANEYSKAIF